MIFWIFVCTCPMGELFTFDITQSDRVANGRFYITSVIPFSNTHNSLIIFSIFLKLSLICFFDFSVSTQFNLLLGFHSPLRRSLQAGRPKWLPFCAKWYSKDYNLNKNSKYSESGVIWEIIKLSIHWYQF